MPYKLKNTTGKYSIVITRPQRCPGCGALCANMQSLIDHESDCAKFQEHREVMPLRWGGSKHERL